MKFFYTLLYLSFSILFCNGQSPFRREVHYSKIDTAISATVVFKSKFYCLKANGEILLIDKSGAIAESGIPGSKALKLLNLVLKNDTLFGVNRTETYFLNKDEWSFYKKGYLTGSFSYQDEKFIVVSTCSGEWGGSLYFMDKHNGKKYECSCTCAVNIIKDENGYIVTASLSHMAGFTNIFLIADPTKLKEYNRDYLKKKKSGFEKKNRGLKYVSYVGENESRSGLGETKLVDSIGIITATSFSCDSQIYYLVEKYKRVSLDIIRDGKLVPVEDLTNLNIWTSDPESRTFNDQVITTFNNDQNSGFISIEKNELSFYIFNRKN